MLRLGLVCDFAEEGWPSMDLVGDMLYEQLRSRYSDRIEADRLRPEFRRRATATGILRSSRTGQNGDRLWNRMVEYPRYLRAHADRYDLFHIVDHSYAHLALTLPAGRTIITCHDLDTFRCLLEPARDPRPLWFRAMAQRILRGFKSARHVIFVSEAVREEADRFGLISKSYSSVVHNGAYCEPEPHRDADRVAARLLGASDGDLLLLSVGSTSPRKRMDVLLNVFARVAAVIPSVRLVRAGGPLTGPQMDLARKLGIAESIVELPFVDRAVLCAVYRKATLLLQPSDAEGFGLPLAEAMAHGCPAVASDIDVLREVGGQAAIYCRAGDVSSWVQTVIELLRKSRSEPVLWSGLCTRSVENARRFSWRRNAEQVVDVYQEAIAPGESSQDLAPLPTPGESAAGQIAGQVSVH
jgi:glycosyltransferase involved in cell wall biosynthesis